MHQGHDTSTCPVVAFGVHLATHICWATVRRGLGPLRQNLARASRAQGLRGVQLRPLRRIARGLIGTISPETRQVVINDSLHRLLFLQRGLVIGSAVIAVRTFAL